MNARIDDRPVPPSPRFWMRRLALACLAALTLASGCGSGKGLGVADIGGGSSVTDAGPGDVGVSGLPDGLVLPDAGGGVADGDAAGGADAAGGPDAIGDAGPDAGGCKDTCDAPGDRECSAGAVVTCVVLESGCLGFGPPVACGAGESCSNGLCSAECTDECAAGGSQCKGEAVQTCGQHDGDECLDWSDPEPCEGCGTCSEGACVATCTDECPSDGATQCQGGGVRVCGQAPGGCCLAWGPVAPCGGGGACAEATCAGGACKVTPLTDAAPCDDGDPCTAGDSCQGGACLSGPAVSCPPGATCVAGACVCGLTIQPGQPIAVDIPFANVAFDVTLGGAPLPAAYTADDWGRLMLRSPDGALKHIGSAAGGKPSTSTLTGRVVPGTYDVIYEAYSSSIQPGSQFPLGTAILANGAKLTPGTTLKLAIPRASVSFDMTLGGAPLPAAYTADDWARVMLRSADGTVTHIGSVSGGKPSVGTLKGYVVPGTYDVLYESYSGAPQPTFSFPAGAVTLAAGVTLSQGAAVKLDIPYALATFDVTLGGASLPTAYTADDWGRLMLRGLDGQVTHIGSVSGGKPSTGTLKMRVIPGSYDVLYESYSGLLDVDQSFPAGAATLASGTAVTQGVTVKLDIPWVALTLDVTLGGASLPGQYAADDWGRVFMRGPDGAQTQIGSVAGGRPSKATLKGRIVPGTYDLVYESYSGALTPGQAFPSGVATLANAVALTAAKTLKLDIPVAQVSFDVTLGGGPLPAKYVSDDWGRLFLRRPDGSETQIGSVAGGKPSTGTLVGKVVPGTFDAIYESYGGLLDAGLSFPSGRAAIATGVKLSNGGTVSLDVPVAEVRFDVTLGKGSLPGAYVADDWGRVSLQGPLGDAREIGAASGGKPSSGTFVGRVIPNPYTIIYESYASTLTPTFKLPLAGPTDLGCADILPTPLSPPPPGPVVINELAYDSPGSDLDVFIELKGPPGQSLAGWSLAAINGNGGTAYDTLALTGQLPADGYLVIAKAGAAAWLAGVADVTDGIADLQNGPDSLQLLKDGVVIDAVAYGDFGGGDVAAGEGSPAPDTTANAAESISRIPDGQDTGDNAADFQVTTLTPGAPNE